MAVYSGELTCSLNTNRFRVAVDEDRSTTGVSKITLTFQYRRTNSYESYSTDVTSTSTIGNINNRSVSVSSTSWVNFGSVTKNYNHTAEQTITITFKSTDAYGRFTTSEGSMQYTMAAFTSAPTAPTISASVVSGTQINVTYGTTNLGNPTGTVYLYNGTTSNPTTQINSKTTTGNTTYNNTGLTTNTRYYYKSTATNTVGSASSSVINAITMPNGVTSISSGSITATSAVLSIVFASSGSALTTTAQISTNNSSWTNTSLTNVQGTTKTYTVSSLTANTQYTRYFRVTTTAGSSASKSVTWTTLPANITSATATSIGETTATVAVTCGSSGSALTTELQISTNNSTWTTVASNVQGRTTNVSLTGLTPNTSVTRYFRVHTTAGNSATYTVTFTTIAVIRFYGSVNNAAKKAVHMYGSVNGQAKKIRKLYGSVNGRAKLIFKE